MSGLYTKNEDDDKHKKRDGVGADGRGVAGGRRVSHTKMLQLRQVLACFGGSEKLLIFASISKIYVSVCHIRGTPRVCVSV